jgi:sRNA-binding regulator protein Hfq
MDLRNDILKSLKLQYESEIQKAKTTVNIYLVNSVGIGEHPQHLEEIDKQIEIISSNEDKLEALNKHFILKNHINLNYTCSNLNLANCNISSNFNDPYAGVNY